jgi:hypothetical protein
MKPTYAVLLVIASMTLILLISSSFSVLGYDIGNEPIVSTLSILGLTQRDMVMGINLSDYDKNYDNFIRILTENNEQQSNDDICTKLFEDCKVPPKETNATSEPNNDNSREFSKKYLEQEGVNIIENRTAATAPITGSNISTSSPEVKPDNVTQTETETETETGAGDLQVYENSGFRIRMLYPTGWEKREDLNTGSVRFVSPREDKDDKYLQTIDLFTYPSMSLNQATESLTNYYKSSLINYTASGSPRTSINANYSSVSTNYTYNDPTAGNISSMDILISPQSSDKTYLVTYRDEASKFESSLPQLEKILDSIKFLK